PRTASMSLKGKTALVTGSTSGIGLAIARALAASGANLVINGFGDPDEVERTRAALEQARGGRALYSPADLPSAEALRAATAGALETAQTGVPVNCISPGYVWTPLVENQIPDTMKARGLSREQVMNDVLLAAQPSKKFVTVDKVAALALFLCRDEAASITGANLSMDGGWTAA